MASGPAESISTAKIKAAVVSLPAPGDLGTVTAPAAIEPAMTESEAARLTTKIQLRLGTIADSVELVVAMIEEARNGNAHTALGYRSWGEYVADKFGGTLGRLTKVQRLPLVELLASQGMSTRQIAPVVGAAFKTVARDLEAAVSNDTPTTIRIPATLPEAIVRLESIDADLVELRRVEYALGCYVTEHESGGPR